MIRRSAPHCKHGNQSLGRYSSAEFRSLGAFVGSVGPPDYQDDATKATKAWARRC